MARHRWATGERTSSPDRLDRVLNLNRAGSDSSTPWMEPPGGEDCGAGEPVGELIHSHELTADDPVAERGTGRRWVATRRAALLAAGFALAVGGWQFVSIGRGSTEVVPLGPGTTASSEASAGADVSAEGASPPEAGKETSRSGQVADGTQAGTVVVHVAGAVDAPGVVEAAAGSRVFEVLEKVGGPLPDAELSAVNLAAVVQDGQQILIPRVGEPLQPVDAAPAPASGSEGAPVNLNTAGVAELEELPRVGPVLAERIVEWRTQHGPFTRPDDLDAVPGIGPAMLESLLPLVTV